MRLNDRLRQMMIGRYGTDQLNLAIIVIYFIISMFATRVATPILLPISYVLFMIVLYRTFSRNINRRYLENQKFMKLWNPIKNKYRNTTKRIAQRKTHKIYKCKHCGQMIRVPKGKGKIAITCPKCKNEFIKRT